MFEEARKSGNRFSVSEVAGRFSQGRGKGAERGRKYHRKILQLDPYPAAYEEVWACPLPLAWRFRFGWLYGVADQVAFVHGIPVRVIEYKSYVGIKRSEEVQASLYGLLTMLCFSVRPQVYLYGDGRLRPLPDWEITALVALSKVKEGGERRIKRVPKEFATPI